MTLDHSIISLYKPSNDFVETVTIARTTYDELKAKAEQLDELLSYDLCKGAIGDAYKQELFNIAVEISCSWFKQLPSEVLSRTRQYQVLKVRDAIIYCLVQAPMTLREIALMLGKKDHSVIVHNRDKILGLMDVDRSYKQEMTNILNLYKVRVKELYKQKTQA
jgi:hypothetical protein